MSEFTKFDKILAALERLTGFEDTIVPETVFIKVRKEAFLTAIGSSAATEAVLTATGNSEADSHRGWEWVVETELSWVRCNRQEGEGGVVQVQ